MACQSVPSQYTGLGQPHELRAFISEHRNAAQTLEARGALREAQREWQLINAITPGDEADRHIQRLEAEIAAGFERHRKAARAAARKGQYRRSRQQLLKALALRPEDGSVISDLKAVEARLAYAAMPAEPNVAKGRQSEVEVYTAQRQQSRKTASPGRQPGQSVERLKQDEQPGAVSQQQVADLVAQGRYEAAFKNLQALRQSTGADPEIDAQIAKIRRILAEQHYTRGVVAFRDARYGEAVNEFEQTLRYQPDHHKARFYLSSAQSLKKQ
jgi:tetratricopeptide (TPR) repeat protein